MSKFVIGLLLGLLIGIGGTAAFLITAGGGDYLILSSPRVKELEGALKNVDQDRQWLRSRLDEANDALAKLESRFSGLAARFVGMAAGQAGAGAAAPAAAPAAEPARETPPEEPAAGPSGDETKTDPSTAPVERSDS
jgi:hypothetical protein